MNPLGLFLRTSVPSIWRFSECLPTLLDPLAERVCFCQAAKRAVTGSKHERDKNVGDPAKQNLVALDAVEAELKKEQEQVRNLHDDRRGRQIERSLGRLGVAREEWAHSTAGLAANESSEEYQAAAVEAEVRRRDARRAVSNAESKRNAEKRAKVAERRANDRRNEMLVDQAGSQCSHRRLPQALNFMCRP